MIANNSFAEKDVDDIKLLQIVSEAVKSAGEVVKKIFSSENRPQNREEIRKMISFNDEVCLDVLRAFLSKALPSAQWVEDEGETGELPPGEWWVIDPVEGAINHIHGLAEWAVSATLVRDNETVLTAVYLPMSGEIYTALRGRGAWMNGKHLHVSNKTQLNAAMVGTGQAVPNEGHDTYRRIGESVVAMLEAALVVKVSVPATLQLIQVAAGRQDIFWQYSQVRSGLLAGGLLVKEAGGEVTDLNGLSWNLGSSNFLAGSSSLIGPAINILTLIK